MNDPNVIIYAVDVAADEVVSILNGVMQIWFIATLIAISFVNIIVYLGICYKIEKHSYEKQ